jgi:hypothetical protein
MSILDDAIREHLDLKRAHGADEAELKRLEDEAFGPPARPDQDPFAEAPTEFLAAETSVAPEADEGESRRRINIADLQEPPPPERKDSEGEDAPSAEAATPAPEAEGAPEPEADVAPEAEADTPAPEAEIESGPSTEERHAIAEQPTEFFDVESEMVAEEELPADIVSPSDEEIAEAEAAEPKLAPSEPPTEIHASRSEAAEEPISEEHDYQDDFFSEQRLSDELDQALEAPLTDEHELPPAAETGAPAADEHETYEREDGEEEDDDEGYESEGDHEDVLEATPDFLEDAPEDDDLWFEQRPPKDFDFDD